MYCSVKKIELKPSFSLIYKDMTRMSLASTASAFVSDNNIKGNEVTRLMPFRMNALGSLQKKMMLLVSISTPVYPNPHPLEYDFL